MEKMQIDGNKAIVTPTHDLVSGDVQKFKNDVNTLAEMDIEEIILDLRNVEMIDSFGVGAILTIYKNMNRKNGKIKLTNASDDIVEMFKLISLDMHFEISGRG